MVKCPDCEEEITELFMTTTYKRFVEVYTAEGFKEERTIDVQEMPTSLFGGYFVVCPECGQSFEFDTPHDISMFLAGRSYKIDRGVIVVEMPQPSDKTEGKE